MATTNPIATFIAEPRNADDLAANQATAEALGLRCPHCGDAGHVTADHFQATRTEPCRLLGITVRCTCQADAMTGRPQVAFIDPGDLMVADHAADPMLELVARIEGLTPGVTLDLGNGITVAGGTTTRYQVFANGRRAGDYEDAEQAAGRILHG